MDFKAYEEELISLRRHFHKNPELGFEEFETQKFIINYLENLGLKPEKIAKTGVVCMIEGKKAEPVIMLRADIDALPVEEETGLEFTSEVKGKMHACGHDGHTSTLLIVAKILNGMKSELEGSIKLTFQPNEENAGAYLMVEEGIMENPKVDGALALHIWSPIESGKVGIKEGPMMASSYYFKVSIKGKGGHGGAPHQANNPVDTISIMLNELNRYQAQSLDVTKPTLITVCKINAGMESPIIIAENASFEGSIRCLHEDGKKVRQDLQDMLKRIGDVRGCEVETEFFYGNEVLINEKKITGVVTEVIKDVIGEENIQSDNVAVMLGDDFSDFSNLVPSCYFFLGSGNAEKGTDYPHHNSKFDIDEDVLIKGVEILVKSAIEATKKL